MPPSKANTEPDPQPVPEENSEELEGAAAFWEALDKRFDAAFERHSAKTPPPTPPKPEPGTSRTGSKRVTLPGIIADIVFGPPKDEAK